MKKILVAIIALLFVGSASAQFKVAEKQKTTEIVWTSFAGHQSIHAQELSNGEYYYWLVLKTSNQFDERICIGIGVKDKAKATLRQLENELHKEGEIYQLIDDRGKPFTMECTTWNQYRITKKGHAGYAYLTVGQASKMLSALD